MAKRTSARRKELCSLYTIFSEAISRQICAEERLFLDQAFPKLVYVE